MRYLGTVIFRPQPIYGKAVAIENVDGLDLAIGRNPTRKSGLTGAEFRYLRKELDLSQGRTAGLLGTAEQAVSLRERKGKIPKTAGRVFRALYSRPSTAT